MAIHRFVTAAAFVIGAAILAGAATGSAAASASFTLDQVMQAPFPTSLAAAPGGPVAWVFDARGRHNIWVADPTHGVSAHAITQLTEDDGYHLDELAWSPDAKWIAYVRGQSTEDDKPANVKDSPDGPQPREVWLVPSAGGQARRLGTGHAPVFSPDSAKVLFVDKGQVMAASPGAGAAAALIVDTGAVGALSFSADGARMAFVSERGSHSLVGVFDFNHHSLTWMSPSLDHDTAPEFSPDGKRVAFIRQPADKTGAAIISRRSGRPWSIWTADAGTGAGSALWVADAGPGSVFVPTLSERGLVWTPRGELVFPWEKSGWLQLYAVATGGGAARALTHGAFEVTHVAVSPDARKLVFSCNQQTDRLQLWALDLETGKLAALGADKGIEDYPQTNTAGAVFALRSDGTHPLHPVMLSPGGQWQMLAAEQIPADFPTAALVAPEAVSFRADDGQEAHGQLFLPHGSTSTPRPAILFFHGGPRRQMLLGFHPMGAYNRMYALNEYLASQGYLVLSVNYRGGIGYGLNYREASDFGPDGGSELHDLLGAITYLQQRKDVDRARIGIWGASYGGLMTALGLARASDKLAAGVDYAGLYNWATFLAQIGAPVEGAEATRKAIASSPIATIEQWRSPVLLVQADDDRNVPSQQASELIEALRAHDIPHEVTIIPNEIHDLALYSSWLLLFDRASAYFQAHLRPTTAR